MKNGFFRVITLLGLLALLPGLSPVRAQEVTPPIDGEGWQEWMRWGIFDLRPHISGAAIFDDNINITQDNEEEDLVWYLVPGISAVAGDPLSSDSKLLVLDYSPTAMVFTDHSEFNAVDHAAKLNARLPFAKLTLGASGQFDSLSTPLVYLGRRVDRIAYSAALTSRYDISPKTSVEVNGRFNTLDYDEPRLIGRTEWSNDNWINYQIAPKLNLGFGATVGYVEVERSPNQIFERALLRALYRITYKLDVNASAGGEWRQYEGVDEITFRPVFTIGAIYRPRDTTRLSLNAYRRDQNSPSTPGLNHVSTGVSVGTRQELGRIFSVSLAGSYEVSDYHFAAFGFSRSVREDDYFLIRLGLDANFSEHWTGGVFVLRREGDSNRPNGVIFSNNQIGLQTTYRF